MLSVFGFGFFSGFYPCYFWGFFVVLLFLGPFLENYSAIDLFRSISPIKAI